MEYRGGKIGRRGMLAAAGSWAVWDSSATLGATTTAPPQGGPEHAQYIDHLRSPTGGEMVGFLAAGNGAEATAIQDKLRRFVDVLDYIPPALHADIVAGVNAVDLTSYIQAAIDAVIADGGFLRVPAGVYKTTAALNVSTASEINIIGDGKSRTVISRENATGPILVLQNASGDTSPSGAGYYFNWHGFRLEYTTPASGRDTNAVGISFELGAGTVGYGYVNFELRGIEVNGAYVGISNDAGAGDPPNVWGWSWDDIVISNFASRALYFVNGGVGGFPACRIGHIYIQGRTGTTYTNNPFVINSADGVSIDVIEWNNFSVNCNALMDFVGSSRGININILRCESGSILGFAAHALLFNSTGHTRVGQIILYNITIADGVVASAMRITGSGTAELGAVTAALIEKSGTTGVMFANSQDVAGNIRYLGPVVGSGTAWVNGDGGNGFSNPSTLHTLSHGLSVLGAKVVGARVTGFTAMTGTATKTAIATYTAPTISNPPTQAEVQALADAVEAISRRLKADDDALIAHGLIGT